MKKIINVLVIILFLVVCFSLAGYTETIVMNDGTEYKGNIHHQTAL